MKFSGKVALVTGANRGIGKEIAKKLGFFNLKVWINYRKNREEATEIMNHIIKNGGDANIISFDVTCEKSFISAIKQIISEDGCLDYLVNNAGITNDKLAIRMKSEDFISVINSNLISSFIGCREAFKIMRKKKFGSIVNISSIVGETGNAGQVNYSASKGGVISMSKSFALEGASSNIRFNTITPGFISTDMTDKLNDDMKKKFIDSIPLGRFGDKEEIANVVAFLLSDYSSYITGETIKVNGGLYM